MYILATVPAMMPWEKEYRFLSWCHLVGSVAPWCGSFVYHLFMNLELGEGMYYRLLQLDMLGIWISQSFGESNIRDERKRSFPCSERSLEVFPKLTIVENSALASRSSVKTSRDFEILPTVGKRMFVFFFVS